MYPRSSPLPEILGRARVHLLSVAALFMYTTRPGHGPLQTLYSGYSEISKTPQLIYTWSRFIPSYKLGIEAKLLRTYGTSGQRDRERDYLPSWLGLQACLPLRGLDIQARAAKSRWNGSEPNILIEESGAGFHQLTNHPKKEIPLESGIWQGAGLESRISQGIPGGQVWNPAFGREFGVGRYGIWHLGVESRI
ncbi:hypothetical protein K438DRAFT_1944133 [Mycena galopus ATCC 62051]|nr:hypothetical protein K438DRAFT_1944133 [Mycena galopus ATCC 62051]